MTDVIHTEGLRDWFQGRVTQADWALDLACQIVVDAMSMVRPMEAASLIAARLRTVRQDGVVEGFEQAQGIMRQTFGEKIHAA